MHSLVSRIGGIMALALVIAFDTTGDTPVAVELWDAIDTHEWIGEPWGGSRVDTEQVDFQDRRCLHVTIGKGSDGWGLIRTKRFPLEDWEFPVIAFKAEVYVAGISTGHVKRRERLGRLLKSHYREAA